MNDVQTLMVNMLIDELSTLVALRMKDFAIQQQIDEGIMKHTYNRLMNEHCENMLVEYLTNEVQSYDHSVQKTLQEIQDRLCEMITTDIYKQMGRNN